MIDTVGNVDIVALDPGSPATANHGSSSADDAVDAKSVDRFGDGRDDVAVADKVLNHAIRTGGLDIISACSVLN